MKGIQDYRDWYYISVQQIHGIGGSGLLQHYHGSLTRALQAVYPDYKWISYQFSRPHQLMKGKSVFSKNQVLLFQHLWKVS